MPTEGQNITADYVSTGLTLRRHPLALLRERFLRRQVHTAQSLRRLETHTHVRIAGLVVIADNSVQAVLIDVGLPGGVSGDQLTRDVHAHRPRLPVILMTGYDEMLYQRAFATDPYVRVIGKPFDIPRLLLNLEALGINGAQSTFPG